MLIDQIKANNIKAMKEHDNDARAVLSIVLTKFKLAEVEARAKGIEIGDVELIAIIQKTLKELDDERSGYVATHNEVRTASIDKQIETIKAFLPTMMSEEEIKNIILSLEDKSIPNVMKHFKANYAGKVDMGLVNKIARSI